MCFDSGVVGRCDPFLVACEDLGGIDVLVDEVRRIVWLESGWMNLGK